MDRLRTTGQIKCTGLEVLGVRPRKEGDAGIEPPDCRLNCRFCGNRTSGSALAAGRIVKVAAGELMACPGDDPPIKAASDCFCAVCASCDEQNGITQPDYLSVRQALKL